MSFLVLVAAVAGIDIGAKLSGQKTISEVLRDNPVEAGIGLVWLAVHIYHAPRASR